MITKEQATKWAEALESGEFKQSMQRLSFYNESTQKFYHCCLGVLCVTMGWDKKDETIPTDRYNQLEELFSPEEGDEDNNSIIGRKTYEKYYYYNDMKRFDFNHIAQLVRKEFVE